ncbi:hypothetical protein HDV00_007702 [Rhizophlyctis rosea]|nr:hypothetical protein HDV00_007702 [Rhizophlyctis rosea]
MNNYIRLSGWGTGYDQTKIPAGLTTPGSTAFLRIFHPLTLPWWGSGFSLQMEQSRKYGYFANQTSSIYETWNMYIYPVAGDAGQLQFQLSSSGSVAADTKLYALTAADPDLVDVSISAWRDTTSGPILMNLGENTIYDYAESLVTYQSMYSNVAVRDAWDAPNPILGCGKNVNPVIHIAGKAK